MRDCLWSVLLIPVVLVLFPAALLAEPLVAPTEAITPAEQQAKFKLPPGFEIQLVAAEPEIQKPMNLAFDARGRLWVTHSIEYPFAAPNNRPARDGLTVLSGIGTDGRATKVERFADGLNIPIGVLPLGAGREAIVWSIPNLWKLRDTDGDGRADEREILYGPFDIADTHGDQNAFRLGLDGWIYACHGFRNDSQIKLRGQGNVVLQLQSGNTYRFRPDGTAIEQVTWGQVNPFGMCVNSQGDWFTADCHSKPLTMLLRGGYYESFGKPHDGLGYAPAVTGHDHGSTGIAGVACYEAAQFPAEYQQSLFVGNVITNIIHRDIPQWHGSSPWVAKPETFVECEDPWFHPVDLQIGPDGALYIADFYNCIIGHYEVDLKHPRRDRERGRIWRVVWTGRDGPNDGQKPALPGPSDLTKENDEQLVERLDSPNWTLRQQAFAWLVERDGAAVVDQRLHAISNALTPRQQVLADWAALRSGTRGGDDPSLRPATDDIVRMQRVRALAELSDWTDAQSKWVRERLNDESPFVRRAAAQAVSRHPSSQNVSALLAAWQATSADDVQLVHALRMALRDQLLSRDAFQQLSHDGRSPMDRQRLVEIALAVPTDAAAWFALRHSGQEHLTADVVTRGLANIVRFGDERRLNEATELLAKRLAETPALAIPVLRGLVGGLRQRSSRVATDSPLGRWGAEQATRWIDPRQAPTPAWTTEPLDLAGGRGGSTPWGLRARKCADGRELSVFDSLVGGETLTGILRSAPFTIPPRLEFWMCGHNGVPGTDPAPLNHIRLRLIDGNEIVARATPPRNDVAQRFNWDLRRWAGQRGVIELVDSNAETAYAWLGVGRFDPEVVANPAEGWDASTTGQELAINLTELLRIDRLASRVRQLAAAKDAAVTVRQTALTAAWTQETSLSTPIALAILTGADEPLGLRSKAAELLGSADVPSVRDALVATLVTAPSGLQQVCGLALASSKPGAEALFRSVGEGKSSARLLQERVIVERLKTTATPDLERRLEGLTKHLPPADLRLRQLIGQRLAGFTASRSEPTNGVAIFKKSCANCHKLTGEGSMIGPQLDGIGQRGAERLLEDLLDPNRNVDAAFRTTTITTTGGLVVTGLKLREEGQHWILADNLGKEIRVAAGDIDESRQSPLSLMPSNLVEMLPEQDLFALLAYLLEQRTARK